MFTITDSDAIRYVLMGLNVQAQDRHPRFACYLGAGASVEAGVKVADQICKEIYDELLKASQAPGSDVEEQIHEVEKTLNWHDQSLRYVSCIKMGYPDVSMRVEYFRSMLKGVAPAFAHHAIALLINHHYFKSTCLTTNFDKLLESAFIQQGDSECQPIRTDEEIRYWVNAEGRNYVIKLHGDYDTQNVLNTSAETVSISKMFKSSVLNLLEYSGLIVIGTAGYEKSVHTLFDLISEESVTNGRVSRFGVLWGSICRSIETPWSD